MESFFRAAASVYGVAVRARAAAYDRGLLGVRGVDGLKVLSVGGVRAGGDGKTPLALYLALELERRGVAVALVCRGYRGRWERPGGVVSSGDGIVRATVVEAGDEAFMMALKAPRIPIVVGADRIAASERARDLGAKVVVLDSGFQHRRLARHLDVATVSWPLEDEEALLPRGRLREPMSALERANIVGYELAGEAPPPLSSSQKSFLYRLRPECLVDERLERCGELSDLSGSRALLVTGIERPHRFQEASKTLGVSVADAFVFPDHHMFTRRDWRAIEAQARRSVAEMILTTEKDMVRLARVRRLGGSTTPPVRALRVAVEIENGDAMLFEALTRFVEGCSLSAT